MAGLDRQKKIRVRVVFNRTSEKDTKGKKFVRFLDARDSTEENAWVTISQRISELCVNANTQYVSQSTIRNEFEPRIVIAREFA